MPQGAPGCRHQPLWHVQRQGTWALLSSHMVPYLSAADQHDLSKLWTSCRSQQRCPRPESV